MMKYQKPNEETPVLALIRKKKQKLKQNIRVRKKIILTGDSMVNDISEKELSDGHSVKIVNFPVGTVEKILKKLDVTIKEKPDDLTVCAGTNDATNNVNHFHLSLILKTRQTSRKP